MEYISAAIRQIPTSFYIPAFTAATAPPRGFEQLYTCGIHVIKCNTLLLILKVWGKVPNSVVDNLLCFPVMNME